jgi:hypothetical protein
MVSCEKTPADRTQAHEQAASLVTGQAVEERLAARPAWLVSDTLSAADFEEDPHTFACVNCHSPRLAKSDKEWRATCEKSGCHVRAWPKTVFHRVQVSTFFKCMTCHSPHVFKLDGNDCLSCHAAMHGPAGTVAVTALEGVSSFPHERHTGLDCGTCHTVVEKHGELAIKSREVCNSCHHGPPAPRDCKTCHSPSEIRGPKLQPLTMTIAGQEENRKLPFDHEPHSSLPCLECHENAAPPRADADCAGCHRQHTRLDRNCLVCHQTPPEGVHSIEVHETGCADCHGDAGIRNMERNRNFCISCHTGMTDHNPGRNCDECHKLAPQPGGRE